MEATREEVYVKHFFLHAGLLVVQEVEQQRCQSGPLQDACDGLIARAESAAAAAVRKYHHSQGALRHSQDAAQENPVRWKLDLTKLALDAGVHCVPPGQPQTSLHCR